MKICYNCSWELQTLGELCMRDTANWWAWLFVCVVCGSRYMPFVVTSWVHRASGSVICLGIPIPTNHPAFCLIKKYCLSLQKIAKSLFFVLTWVWCIMPIHFEWTHTIFKLLQIKQTWHISQAKVHLQVGRYDIQQICCSTQTGQSPLLDIPRQPIRMKLSTGSL